MLCKNECIMNSEEKIQFVREVELLKDLELEEYNALSCCLEEKRYPQDAFLFKENEPRKDIFIIYSGEVVLLKFTASGQEKRLAHFSSGDFLGEGSWADETPHSTSARALEDTIVLIINKQFFLENGSTAIKIFSNIARVISRRLRHANSRAVNSSAQYESGKTRKEHDLLGEREVPNEYYYGIQTLRALENSTSVVSPLTSFLSWLKHWQV